MSVASDRRAKLDAIAHPVGVPDLELAEGPLAIGEMVAPHTNIPAAAADVNGLTITFTPDRRTVIIKTFVPFVLAKTTAGIASLLLTNSANTLIARTQQQMAVNDQRNWEGPRARITNLVPGVPVTFKLRANAAPSQTIDVYADPTYKAFIRADYER